MILPFSQQLNGKPTYFVEKVLSGLLCYELEPEETQKSIVHYSTFSAAKYEWTFEMIKEAKPKFHTIREDKKNRWKVGTKIDFFINCRQKDMFRFAPVLPVVSIQEIEIFWYSRLRLLEPSKLNKERYNYVEISIDGRMLTIKEINELAINDGFDSVEDFFNYFNSNFKGVMLHWTNIRY